MRARKHYHSKYHTAKTNSEPNNLHLISGIEASPHDKIIDILRDLSACNPNESSYISVQFVYNNREEGDGRQGATQGGKRFGMEQEENSHYKFCSGAPPSSFQPLQFKRFGKTGQP